MKRVCVNIHNSSKSGQVQALKPDWLIMGDLSDKIVDDWEE
jgi:hypothetical protein